MHASSYRKMQHFVDAYLAGATSLPLRILDFGSQQVNPVSLTYRTLLDRSPWTYIGLDIADGHNVTIKVDDAYDWSEVASDSVDVVVSGQAFEHVEFFWASAFEIGRVLKPGGLLMLIAPSGGYEHRFPLDCWRYYTDGMRALTAYLRFELVDAYTDWGNEVWEDSVVVMRKPITDLAGTQEFARRSAMQRALLAPGAELPAVEVPTSVPAASELPAPIPGTLTELLRHLTPAEKVKGRAMWLGERMAGVRGRRIASELRGRLDRSRRASAVEEPS
jgi:SAM-dependent methyltransferase